MQESGMLQDLFNSMVGPTAHVDQVGFANTVEAYKRLSKVPHCYDFLISSGVMAKLEERIVDYGPGTMEDKVMPSKSSALALYGVYTSSCPRSYSSPLVLCAETMADIGLNYGPIILNFSKLQEKWL
jgi:hypothetical protein